MEMLKLVALDEQDLVILSAHAQDSVAKVGGLVYEAAAKRFVLAIHRFAWEKAGGLFGGARERRASVLHFDRVLAVKISGIDRANPEEILSLLAIRFHPGDAPGGAIELIFSGEGAIRLEVECIEARLADLGGAWEATSRPVHKA